MIEIATKTTCKECGNEFRFFPHSTITPKRCKLCQNKADLLTKKVSASRIVENKKKLAQIEGKGAKKGKKPRKLDDKLDEAWSMAVKVKAGFRCQVCFNTKMLNAHHIYSRAKKSVRWDLDNGVCLCVNHHVGFTFSAHKTPVEFTDWLRFKYGESKIKILSAKASSTSHLTEFEKEIILTELKSIIERK